METTELLLETRLAATELDLLGAQRLRYRVFVEELGGSGDLVDHDRRLERDPLDPYCDHLVLVDRSRSPDPLEHVVGVYRLLRGDREKAAGGFYSETEYDLTPIRDAGRPMLELGRSCLDADYRGGTAMVHLWAALTKYVREHGIEVLFGVASFHGTDVSRHAASLSLLYQRHLAPPDLRVTSRVYEPMNLVAPERLDRRRAMVAVPSLIKGYLRLGGYVGDGAYVDRAFNTTDVCLVMDTTRINTRSLALYAGFA